MPHHNVFICYNSGDQAEIRKVAGALKSRCVSYFLDTDQLPLGTRLDPRIEHAIANSDLVAVFIGSNGWGPYQREEVDFSLRLSRSRSQSWSSDDTKGFPVFGILLPGASPSQIEQTMLGNRRYHRLDSLAEQDLDLLVREIASILGINPESGAQGRRNTLAASQDTGFRIDGIPFRKISHDAVPSAGVSNSPLTLSMLTEDLDIVSYPAPVRESSTGFPMWPADAAARIIAAIRSNIPNAKLDVPSDALGRLLLSGKPGTFNSDLRLIVPVEPFWMRQGDGLIAIDPDRREPVAVATLRLSVSLG